MCAQVSVQVCVCVGVIARSDYPQDYALLIPSITHVSIHSSIHSFVHSSIHPSIHVWCTFRSIRCNWDLVCCCAYACLNRQVECCSCLSVVSSRTLDYICSHCIHAVGSGWPIKSHHSTEVHAAIASRAQRCVCVCVCIMHACMYVCMSMCVCVYWLQ